MERDITLEKKIDAYIKGHLNEDEALQLWEELLEHPEYIELLNTELGLRSILYQKEEKVPEKEMKSQESLIHSLQNSWKWVGAAAAILILVFSINFFQESGTPSLQSLTVQNINLSENLISASVLRSERQPQIAPEDSLLNLGYKAAIDGNLAEATRLYEAIIARYPDKPIAVQAYLNKGIIQFNREAFEEAITSFQAVVSKAKPESFTKEKGYWFLGNTYINLNRLDAARAAILEAYKMNGIYHDTAIDLLKELDEKLGKADQKYE
ncbi:MAG TPA: tetratricopeptide repeat protein [Fodinibius sp.]|nr:tetratricopeptide repeat protein [Fodinibius sp.]